jgi:hypothetical protein
MVSVTNWFEENEIDAEPACWLRVVGPANNTITDVRGGYLKFSVHAPRPCVAA